MCERDELTQPPEPALQEVEAPRRTRLDRLREELARIPAGDAEQLLRWRERAKRTRRPKGRLS